MKKRKAYSFGSIKLGNASAIIGIFLYCGGRYLEAAIKFSDYTMRQAQTLSIFGFTLLITLILLMRFTRTNREVIFALLVPLLCYSFLMGGCITTNDFEFFFLMHLAIFSICCQYQHFPSSVIFLTMTFIADFCLFLFYFPNLDVSVTRVAYSSNRTYPSGILFIDWFISFIASIELLVLTRVASTRSGEANRGLMSFDTLLASTPNYMVLIDEMKRVMYISEPLMRLAKSGGSSTEIGRPLLDLFDNKDIKLMFSDIIDSNDLFEDTRELVIDGQVKYFKIIANKLTGIVDGMFIDLTDISPVILSKMEADDARQAAEKANSAKSDFLARMSHEIRTPMNAIIGMGDLMRTDNLDRVQTGYFNDIRRSSQSLMQIINDILDFSRIEAQKLELIPMDFSLKSLYDDVCSPNMFAAGVKDLEFRCSLAGDVPDIVYGDEIRVRQIISNLLSNSIKYTRTGYVSFSVIKDLRHGGDSIGFIIEDSGIGIKNDDIPRLFDSFERIDQVSNRNIVGTGLGLSIVKRLTDLMGGRIEVQSEYGVGSSFAVYLPLPPGDAYKIAGVQSAPHVIATPHTAVLVVDDNRANLTVARAFLSSHGIDADVATSGYEAVNKVRRRIYDIVFMDHMMPDINGIEATRLIRAIDTLRHQSLPIIALTANAVAGDRKMFLAAGMSDYLPKPILAVDMNKILLKWLPPERILRYEDKPRVDIKSMMYDSLEGKMINAEHGLMHSVGNEELYRQLLIDFERYQRDAYRRIVDGINNGDFTLSFRLAHTLKNTARTIGADALAEAAQVVEEGLSEGEMLCTDGQLYALRQALQEALAEVGGIVSEFNWGGARGDGHGDGWAHGGVAAGDGHGDGWARGDGFGDGWARGGVAAGETVGEAAGKKQVGQARGGVAHGDGFGDGLARGGGAAGEAAGEAADEKQVGQARGESTSVAAGAGYVATGAEDTATDADGAAADAYDTVAGADDTAAGADGTATDADDAAAGTDDTVAGAAIGAAARELARAAADTGGAAAGGEPAIIEKKAVGPGYDVSDNRLFIGGLDACPKLSEPDINDIRGVLAGLTPLVKSHRASALEFTVVNGAVLALLGGTAELLVRQIYNFDYKNAADTLEYINTQLVDAARRNAAP